ncbi:MAG: CBS domain-containing protein [Proteobacteria bacterium]|nr:CBS domain-containing protein [Pseudomonadota bacterium]MBU1689019.1 CBS domain-containing protein [Pseudomonadota bacterium]
MEIITTHLNADFDGLASMIAAQKVYPQAVMSFSGSQEKNLRDFLAKSPHLYDFQRQKNIDLASVTRLILVDTRQAGRLGKFAECLTNPGLSIHIYDHHPILPGDLKGDFEEVRPLGSTATVFTQIFQEQSIPVSADEATVLAMAIYEDTGSFVFDTTTPADLAAMAWLLEQGANLHTVSQFITHELTTHQVTLLHTLMKSAVTYAIQGIDIVVAKIELPEYIDEFALVVRRFMSMENLNCLMALASMGERLYLIARSRIPEVNAGEIAIAFGGGGHASAASATVKNMTLVEAEEQLITILHQHVRPVSLAGEIMSSPVISVIPEVTIKEANQIIDRYNITVLPVIKADGTMIGLISRRVAGKAIYHGLGDQPVSEYMTSEFATLTPTATLAEIQELIIENRQRFIPVVEKNMVIGVITRTDLLNLLVNDPIHLPKNLLAPDQQPSVDRQRNINTLMVENLARDIIILLRTLGEIAHRNGYTAYAVGGFVRDLLMRKVNLDLDIVIEGDGIDFAKKFAARFGAEVRTHEKFNTAVIIMPGNGFKIDVATARLEYYEYPAAMPTVELSSLKLDLYRRDFTVNALALHLAPTTFGTLMDFFNCQNDIKERKIRILHNLSFVEDPTRIFRAIRFEQRMAFTLASHTERLIKSAVKMDLFGSFGKSGNARSNKLGFRIFTEMKLILAEQFPLPAIRRLIQFDLPKFLYPALHEAYPSTSLLEAAHQAVVWYRLLYQEERFRQWIVFTLVLTSRLTHRQLEGFCRRLEVPERHRQILLREKNHVTRLLRTLKRHQELKPSECYRLLRPLAPEGLLYLMSMVNDQQAKKAISLFITRLRHISIYLNGNDLKQFGYPTGPLYRRILDRLLKARLDKEVDSRDDEIIFLRKHFPINRYRDSDQHPVKKKNP